MLAPRLRTLAFAAVAALLVVVPTALAIQTTRCEGAAPAFYFCNTWTTLGSTHPLYWIAVAPGFHGRVTLTMSDDGGGFAAHVQLVCDFTASLGRAKLPGGWPDPFFYEVSFEPGPGTSCFKKNQWGTFKQGMGVLLNGAAPDWTSAGVFQVNIGH